MGNPGIKIAGMNEIPGCIKCFLARCFLNIKKFYDKAEEKLFPERYDNDDGDGKP